MKTTCSLLLLCLTFLLNAQAPTWKYVERATYFQCGLQRDLAGNIFAAGYSGNSLHLTKYSKAGTALWSKTVAMADIYFNGVKMAVSPSGRIFLAGNYTGKFMTAGTAAAVTNPSVTQQQSIFVTCLNSNGVGQWSKAYLTPTSWDYVAQIQVDAKENLLLYGCYYYNAMVIENDTLPATMGYDQFTVKFSPAGKMLWVKPLNLGKELPSEMVLGNDGSIYQTYYTNEVVLVKYDSTYQKLWSKNILDQGSFTVHQLRMDAQGNCYVITDKSISKHSATGTLIYEIPLVDNNFGFSLNDAETSSDGSIYLAGTFVGHTSLQGQTASTSYTYNTNHGTAAGAAMLIVKLDAGGAVKWIKTAEGLCHHGAVSLVLFEGESLCVHGHAFGEMKFDDLQLAKDNLNSYFIAILDLNTLVSLKETVKSDLIRVFPNPSSGDLRLSVPVQEITILNVYGQLIYSEKSDQGLSSIDLSGYSSGMYLLRLRAGDHQQDLTLVRN